MKGVRGCTMPVPAGSAMAPPQSTAEPVRDTGGTSGKMYLRKGKMLREKGQNQGQSSRSGSTAELIPSQRYCSPWIGPSRVEETTMKEGAAEEKSEEQGATESNHGALTQTIASREDGV